MFDEPTADALAGAIWRALELHRDERAWRQVQRAGMRRDFSWAARASVYRALYEKRCR